MAKRRSGSRKSHRKSYRKSHRKSHRKSRKNSRRSKLAARRRKHAITDATGQRTITSSCGKRSKTQCSANPNCTYSSRRGCHAKKHTRGLLMLNLD